MSLSEHHVDPEKVPGMMEKGSGEAPEDRVDQRYIVVCQVVDPKARGVNTTEQPRKDAFKVKTRAIYKMDDRLAQRWWGSTGR